MPNRSHFNSGLRTLNAQNRSGKKHSSHIYAEIPKVSHHWFFLQDAMSLLPQLPDSCVDLILIDPPYNLDIAAWDTYTNYLDWAKNWLLECQRLLADHGNLVLFGGFQFQEDTGGDLLELMHYMRHHTTLKLINVIVWHYYNGMGGQRFFSNRHEEIVWFAKTKQYFFDLDAVRIPYDEATKTTYKRDKRLNHATIDKGKNPTNVWEIKRLNANSKERVGHPTQKPMAIIQRLIRGLSFPGAVVLDFFCGSGTTGRAAIQENRHSILCDADPAWLSYFEKHKAQFQPNLFTDYTIHQQPKLETLLDFLIQRIPNQKNKSE